VTNLSSAEIELMFVYVNFAIKIYLEVLVPAALALQMNIFVLPKLELFTFLQRRSFKRATWSPTSIRKMSIWFPCFQMFSKLGNLGNLHNSESSVYKKVAKSRKN